MKNSFVLFTANLFEDLIIDLLAVHDTAVDLLLFELKNVRDHDAVNSLDERDFDVIRNDRIILISSSTGRNGDFDLLNQGVDALHQVIDDCDLIPKQFGSLSLNSFIRSEVFWDLFEGLGDGTSRVVLELILFYLLSQLDRENK